LAFIDGSLPKPTKKEDEEFSESYSWDMANLMLCLWLLNIVDPKLQMTIAYLDTVKIMWDDLKRSYGMANMPKIHPLKAYIANYK